MSKRVILVERVNKPTFQKGGIIMKARKLISCALALILIFSTLPVFTVSQAEYWSWEIKKYSQKFGDWRIIPAMSTDDDDGRHINYKSYYIIDYYGNKTNVKVPSKVNGKKIVGLEEKVFAGKKIMPTFATANEK